MARRWCIFIFVLLHLSGLMTPLRSVCLTTEKSGLLRSFQEGEYLLINYQSYLFLSLPLSDEDKKNIQYIFSTLANKNPFQLIGKTGDLEKRGKKVEHVHPLRSIGYIVSDPYLKKCLREVKKNSFKWNGFLKGSRSLKGFADHMKEEYRRNNLERYVPGFCEQVHESQEEILKYIRAQDWEGMAKYLIR